MICSQKKVSYVTFSAAANGSGKRRPSAGVSARSAVPLLAALLLGAGMPTHADAQAQSASAPRQGLRIEPSLTLVYDDNVYRVDTDRVEPVDDLIVTPAVEARFDRDIGPRAISLRAFVGYDQFVSETERSKPRIELEGSGRLLIAGQCNVRPLASYRQQRADYGDINNATENLQRFSSLGIRADCERSAGLYPLAAYRRDTTRNGGGFEYADQTSNLVRAGMGYARPSLGTLTAYYERVSSDRAELGIRNRSDAAGLSFDRSVSPLTSIFADVRWMHVTSSTDAIGSYDGPGWTLRLSTLAVPRLRLAASTERTIVNDSLIASGFAVRTAHRVSADIGLSELTSIGAFGEFVRREFRQDASIRPFNFTRDRTNQFGFLARRKITDDFAVDLSVSRIQRSTNSDIANYRATRVALGATMGF